MPNNLTIPKDTSSFPEYLNWELLRNTGIKHIENLGSDLWTDYNLHDPGITILEVLCYALTDLGYRTHLDIKDILARSPEEKKQAIKTVFNKPRDDNFFTASEILSCNPVTLNDFRKLLIDVPGVKNAWLIPAAEGEVPIVLSKNKDKLAKDNYKLVFANQEPVNNKRIKIQGLFEIMLELEALPVRDACGSIIFTKNGILETVHEKLNAHRNLCEDIKKISIFGEEQIQICANIELEPTANPELVLLEMYKRLEEHLSPTLPFYTLQEMLKKGRSMEEIFEGRPLSKESNGFIDSVELERLSPKKSLYTSDFYRIIMDIDGVIAIRELTLSNAIDGVVMHKGEKWCLNLTPRYRPNFHLKASQITFYKGRLPFTTDKEVVSQRYLEERVAKAKAKLEGYQLDLPVPEGQHRQLEDYTSIMEDFPLTYGVGSDGLKGLIDAKRKGQAKQLKSYLLFFDQLLANYLSQLANVRELFSLSSDEKRAGKTHTYFTQILSEVPGIKDLLINFHECENNDEDGVPPEDFPSYLQHISENLENYQSRRTRFLDHLLARFSESFSDYVLLMYEMNGKQHENTRIIKNKADFLSGYPEISRNRGKAFNYTLPAGCKATNPCNKTLDDDKETDTENISGLEKRVAKLIGIENTHWTTLGNAIIEEQTSGWTLIIQRQNNSFLKSKSVWESEAAACEVLKEWNKYLGNEQYIKRLTFEGKGKKEFALVIKKQNGKEIAFGTKRFSSLNDCSKTRNEIYSSIKDIPEPQIAYETINGISYFVVKDEEGLELFRFEGKDGDIKDFGESIKQKENFCKKTIRLSSSREYGFIIVNDREECLAQSTIRYSNEEEREEAIFWLIGQIRWSGLSGRAIGEKECYAFQLFDFRGDQLLLQSLGGFPSISETMAFFNPEEQEQEGLLHLATQPENYLLLEEGGKFSFSIKNEMGKIVSLHPSWYDSEIEVLHLRDAIIYYLKNGSPETEIDGTPGDFKFEIADTAGNVLFIGFGTYPTMMEARSASSLVKVLARHRRYYKPVEREGELPYGFELVNRSDVSFAGHPNWYATACERDLAMEAIINYSENLNPQHQITEKENKFFLNLLGPDGNDLLFGTIGYSDKETAEANWQHFLDLAIKKENFQLTDSGDTKYPSGFQLLDEDELEMAKSSFIYATEAESKMALLSIVHLVSHTEWSVAITGDPGDYHYWIGDGKEEKFLESVQEYPDEGSARLGLKKVIDLGQNPDNYHQTKNFGIKLTDKEGNAIASHPKKYENEAQVKMAIFKIVSFLRKDDPRIEIPNIGGAFRPVIFDEGGKIALKGTKIHSNKEKALGELDEILEFAGTAAYYKQQEDKLKRCQNGFYLVNKEGEAIATHPYHYLSPQDRDENMAAVFGRLTHAQQLTEDAIKKKSLFSFQLSGMLKVASIKSFDQEEEASEVFNDFLEAGRDLSRYLPNEIEAKHGFTILSATGTTLARSISEFESKQERDRAMKKVWLTIRLKATGFRVFQDEEQEKWHFALEDQEGRDYLLGNLYIVSEEEAIDAMIKAFDYAQNKSQYLSRKGKEEEASTFDLVDEEGSILATYARTGFDTEVELAESIEQYIHFLSNNKPVPTIVETKVNYFFELSDFTENVILNAVKPYSSIETATTDWLKMAEATQDSSNIEIVYNNENCNYKIYLKVENEILGQSTQKITSRTQAERWIELIRLILQKRDPHGDALGTTCGFHFILTPPESEEALKDIQIKGANRYPTSSEALRESEKVAKMLGVDQLFLVEQKDDQWQLSLYDENEKFLAIILPLFDDEAEAIETRNLLRTFLKNGNILKCGDDGNAKADEVEVSYRSIIKKEDKSYLESPSFKTKVQAEAASNTIHEWGQTENRYNLVTNEEECLYSYELTDEYGISIATHPTFYKRAKDRDEALQKTLSLISAEGLRLVEHILLRPKKEGIQQSYRFQLVDTDTNIPVLEGETSYLSEVETWEAYRNVWVSIWKSVKVPESDHLIEKLDDLEAPCQFSFNIRSSLDNDNENAVVASSYGGFSSAEKRDGLLEKLIKIIENYTEEPDNDPELPVNLVAKVYPLRLDYDLLGCKLMKPILDHYKPGGSNEVKYVDPYSFRATVVLPYWPTRFQRPEFRQFIETTLRKEAPAHVFLRICWVDTKDMKDFEDAYCSWLSTIQLGSDACNAIEAKNNLVTTLCKLRSVYPVASLHDCQAPSEDSNRIVLNYSIIGSANSQ